MKRTPYPDKKFKNKEEVARYYEELIINTMSWLKVDGYSFLVYLPNEEDFVEHKDAGMSITVEYPYKKFKVSIQQDTLDKSLKLPLGNPFWENTEKGVFHEILHIILWRLTELATKRYVTPIDIEQEDESTVDYLTNIIYPIVRDNRKLSIKNKKK